MKWVSSSGGVLRALGECEPKPGTSATIKTDLPALDDLLPDGAWRCGCVHEMISQGEHPIFPLLVARKAAARGTVVWCDPAGELHLPAVAALGLPLEKLILLRPRSPADLLWAVNECLRCKGVSACVAKIEKLTMVDARRLQLSAEGGGGVGLLLRPESALRQPYAAATRWRIRPTHGERTIHRWKVQLIHGHGGRVGKSVVLEVSRDKNIVRASETVGDRQTASPTETVTG